MTHLVDAQHPVPPRFQQQGPDTNCIIDGKLLGWESCSAFGEAHLIDSVSAHLKQPSGCAVRRYTGDTVGGLSIPQVAYVAEHHFGTPMDVHVGSNVVRPSVVARKVREGRRAILQGDAIAFLGTTWRSTRGAVAHLIELNEVRGGTLDEPAEGLIYDSAADGDLHSWGRADQGPSWIKWSVIKKFMASLRPGGPGTPMIGGWCYCAFSQDTQPWVRLLTGAVKATPFPDRVRTIIDNAAVHTKPSGSSPVRYRIPEAGTLVRLYQYVEGTAFKGSTRWGVNDDGTEFIHLKRLDHVGGGS